MTLNDMTGFTTLPSSYLPNNLLKSGLKINHLRMMIALSETGQISAAAELMNISQPAASRILNEMESILKIALYERLPRGVTLTRYGEALARRAQTIMLELREVSREIMELQSGSGGSVFIGTVQASTISMAVPAITRISSAYPGIEINLTVDTSVVLARELLSAKHDFIIGRIPDDLNPRLFEARDLGLERASLIVRNGHPLLEKGIVSLADLPEYQWVFQPPGTLLRRTVEDLFLKHNVPLPKTHVNTASAFLTMAIVSQSDAIAPVTRDMALFVEGQSSRMGEIAVLQTDFELVVKPFSLILAAGRALTPSAKLLYNAILDESQKLRPIPESQLHKTSVI